jgi:hypothetical protein
VSSATGTASAFIQRSAPVAYGTCPTAVPSGGVTRVQRFFVSIFDNGKESAIASFQNRYSYPQIVVVPLENGKTVISYMDGGSALDASSLATSKLLFLNSANLVTKTIDLPIKMVSSTAIKVKNWLWVLGFESISNNSHLRVFKYDLNGDLNTYKSLDFPNSLVNTNRTLQAHVLSDGSIAISDFARSNYGGNGMAYMHVDSDFNLISTKLLFDGASYYIGVNSLAAIGDNVFVAGQAEGLNPGWGARGSISDKEGNALISQFAIPNNGPASDGMTVVLTLDNTRVVAAWQDNTYYPSNSPASIRAQILGFDGRAFTRGEDIPVSQMNHAFSDDIHDHCLNSLLLKNGNFIIYWTSRSMSSEGTDIWARSFDANGSPLTNEFRVNKSTVDDQGFVSAAESSEGIVTFVWTTGNATTGNLKTLTTRVFTDSSLINQTDPVWSQK